MEMEMLAPKTLSRRRGRSLLVDIHRWRWRLRLRNLSTSRLIWVNTRVRSVTFCDCWSSLNGIFHLRDIFVSQEGDEMRHTRTVGLSDILWSRTARRLPADQGAEGSLRRPTARGADHFQNEIWIKRHEKPRPGRSPFKPWLERMCDQPLQIT